MTFHTGLSGVGSPGGTKGVKVDSHTEGQGQQVFEFHLVGYLNITVYSSLRLWLCKSGRKPIRGRFDNALVACILVPVMLYFGRRTHFGRRIQEEYTFGRYLTTRFYLVVLFWFILECGMRCESQLTSNPRVLL